MPFVEVFTPPGALTAEQREIIGQRLVAEVMRAEGAPDTAQARAISWLAWHDLQLWSVGGQPVAPDEAVRYVVRVAVPAASITDESRAEIIGRVTSVLAEADADPPRFFDTPCAYVLVDPIPDGHWGVGGRPVNFDEIAAFVLGTTTQIASGAPGD